MIDTTALKNSILDLAFHGKLTSQNVTDGSAEELYNQICDEKRELIKSGKIKKNKIVPIKEEDIPFEIPNNWKWIRWGDLSEKIQYGYNASAKSEGRIKMVRISDIQDNKVLWNTVPYCEIDEEQIPEYLLKENDILFARTGGTVGKSYIVSDVSEDAVFAGYLIRTSYSNKLSSQYMKYFMESKLYWKQLRNGTIATAQPNCNGQTLSKMMVPLPPYAEQVRIIETIEKAFAQIDVIDSLQQQYSSDLEVLKSKIIDAGIQGKLTEQLPGDGTAEELLEQIAEEKKQLIKEKKIKATKALSEITEDEIPFEIPDNWKWIRFNDIANIIGTGMIRSGQEQYDEAEYYYFKMNNIENFTGKCDFKSMSMVNASEEEYKKYRLVEGDFLFNTRNSAELVGKTAVVHDLPTDKILLNNNILKILFYGNISSDYINYFFISKCGRRQLEQFITSTTNVAAIYQRQIVTLTIPLPPLAEQRRIVERIETILNVIDN